MRYIADSNGYVKEVSFGAMITCDGSSCKNYTGGVPSGYSSLEDWFVAECEQLYRWKVVNGNLVMDAGAVAPAPPTYSELDMLRIRIDGIEKQVIYTATMTGTLREIEI